MKKTLKRILTGALIFRSLGGCANNFRNSENDTNNTEYISDVSKIPRPVYILDGYITSKRSYPILQNLAGIHAGTIDVDVFVMKDGDSKIIKIVTEGYYSLIKNPESMREVIKAADINRNKIISDEEAKDLQDFFIKSVSENNEVNK